MWTSYLTEELLFDVFHKEKAFAREYFFGVYARSKVSQSLSLMSTKSSCVRACAMPVLLYTDYFAKLYKYYFLKRHKPVTYLFRCIAKFILCLSFPSTILQCCSGSSHLRGNLVTCTPRVFRVHFSCNSLLQHFVQLLFLSIIRFWKEAISRIVFLLYLYEYNSKVITGYFNDFQLITSLLSFNEY